MAERLSSLAYAQQQYGNLPSSSSQQQQQYQHQQQFNPRSISLDIHSPEELAAVNEFLLTLGKDITSTSQASARRHQQAPDYSSHHHAQPQQAPLANLGSPASYFDAVSLSQLGLANMPGIPSLPSPASATSSLSSISGYGTGDYQQSYSPPVRVQPSGLQTTGLYPGFDDHSGRISHGSRSSSSSSSYLQTIALSPADAHPPPPHSASSSGHTPTRMYHSRAPSNSSSFRPTPPLSSGSPADSGTRSPSPLSISSHSASGQLHAYSQHRQGMAESADTANFDFLARASAAMEQPQLGAYEYAGARTLRTVLPLKSVPGREDKEDEIGEREKRTRYILPPPGPVEPRLRTAIQRGPPARLSSSVSSHESDEKSKSLYPHLQAGDEEFRLPPLVGASSSRPKSLSSVLLGRSRIRSRTLSSELDSPQSSPRRVPPTLPSIHSLTADLDLPPSRRTSTSSPGVIDSDLAKGVSQIRIEGKGGVAVPLDERRRHAELIRDLLVAINKDYRERFGTPPPHDEGRIRDKDIEMVGVH